VAARRHALGLAPAPRRLASPPAALGGARET